MGTLSWLAIGASLAVGLLGRWITCEFGVWHEPLCKFFIRRGAASLPLDIRIEVVAEQLKIVEDLRSPTQKFFHAFSCWLFAGRTRRALGLQQRWGISIDEDSFAATVNGRPARSGSCFVVTYSCPVGCGPYRTDRSSAPGRPSKQHRAHKKRTAARLLVRTRNNRRTIMCVLLIAVIGTNWEHAGRTLAKARSTDLV
jgi:hypothetical protein